MWINGARVPLGNLERVILVAIKEIDVEGQALALSRGLGLTLGSLCLLTSLVTWRLGISDPSSVNGRM